MVLLELGTPDGYLGEKATSIDTVQLYNKPQSTENKEKLFREDGLEAGFKGSQGSRQMGKT